MSELERLPARVTEVGTQTAQLRTEMHAEFSAVRAEIRDDDETRRLMRVLHEDLVARIALICEGRPRRKKER